MYVGERTMVIVTYNIDLQMNESSFGFWKDFLSKSKEAYNMCASILVENNTPLDLHHVHEVVYDELRNKFNTLPAQCIIKIYKEVLAALRSIRSNKQKNADIPQRKQLALRIDKRLYSNLSVEGIALTGEVRNKRTFYPFIKFPKMETLFSEYKTKDPLLFIRDNRIFLSVPFEVAVKPLKNDTSVGVDLGMKRLFVTSEGVAYRDKRYLKRRRELRYLKRCLQSKGSKSAKKHLNKVRRKERNISKDMCYRASNALLASTKANIIVMEDLSKIKKTTSKTKEGFKRKRHNNAMAQVPFYLFKEILTHKTALVGKQVVTVSPAYTSQTDCRTNKRDGNRNGCRYLCSDGKVYDADWNASINIAKRGKHPFANVEPIDGQLKFLNGRELSASHTLNSFKSRSLASQLL